MPQDSLTAVYRRLSKEAGLTRPYLRDVILPEWWDDDAASSPAGMAEFRLIVSKRAGLDFASFDEDVLRHTCEAPYKLKTQQGTDAAQITAACSIAARVAALAAVACDAPYEQPGTATEVRSEILDTGAPWVGFDELVDYCWSKGIPVLNVSRMPPKSRKMDGMAANVGGRPVILICSGRKHPAWLLFILAHELGHVALGHVEPGGVLVDEKVDTAGSEAGIDAEEIAANKYGIEVLCGDRDRRYDRSRYAKADRMAREAEALGRQHRVDPGHILLSFGHTSDNWKLANAALTHLRTGKPDGLSLLADKLGDRLDWERLPRDSADFLARMCGLSERD